MNPPHPLARTLSELTLDNTYARLPERFYARVRPQPLTAPRLLHANAEVAALIGLDPAALSSDECLQVFSGARPLPGGDTLAAVYSGHQFGVWAGQLGDGRAHLLGEVCGQGGNWELQLKGSGRTPYSRMGDGRAVLRSSVREYLASEAMHGLGIASTRALALVVSDDPVYREAVETAAIVTRMAPSFVRFGSFEHWMRDAESLRILLDYVIDRHYPDVQAACRDATPAERALALLRAVAQRTAVLLADWMRVGFCHGVMNTDNMSILGLTLDYGPYGFIDGFDARHVCNHSDSAGRYAWNTQPSVAYWNLTRLAVSLHALVGDKATLQAALADFEPTFTATFNARIAAKLGLADWRGGDDGASFNTLVNDLWRLMHANRADFTLSFRRLSQAVLGTCAPFLDLFADRQGAQDWLARHAARLAADAAHQTRPAQDIAAAMDAVNPVYVLRNHLAEQAIRAAQQTRSTLSMSCATTWPSKPSAPRSKAMRRKSTRCWTCCARLAWNAPGLSATPRCRPIGRAACR